MPFRLVHCADVHLETVFPETRGGAARRGALADAFVRIVDEALAREADALTIGGDLYEAERAGPQTARFIFEQLARFAKPVYVAPGNHDPYSPSSLFARGDVPANVKVFNEAAWRAYPLAPGLTIFGFGHTPAEPGRPFARARFERGGVQIALVHGSDDERCPPNKRATAPFRAHEVTDAGASLLLTGHYHGGYVIAERDRPVFAYPGSPEPIKYGENPTHGALFVTVEGEDVRVEPFATARTRLVDLACTLDAVTHDHAAFARIETALAPFGADDYVRLRLTGHVAPGTRLDLEHMTERFGAALGSLAIADATVGYDFDALAREPTVRGRVARELLAGGDESAAALRYALAAFDGSEIAP